MNVQDFSNIVQLVVLRLRMDITAPIYTDLARAGGEAANQLVNH